MIHWAGGWTLKFTKKSKSIRTISLLNVLKKVIFKTGKSFVQHASFMHIHIHAKSTNIHIPVQNNKFTLGLGARRGVEGNRRKDYVQDKFLNTLSATYKLKSIFSFLTRSRHSIHNGRCIFRQTANFIWGMHCDGEIKLT